MPSKIVSFLVEVGGNDQPQALLAAAVSPLSINTSCPVHPTHLVVPAVERLVAGGNILVVSRVSDHGRFRRMPNRSLKKGKTQLLGVVGDESVTRYDHYG